MMRLPAGIKFPIQNKFTRTSKLAISIFMFLLLVVPSVKIFAANPRQEALHDSLVCIVNKYCKVDKLNQLRVSLFTKTKTIDIDCGIGLSEMPFREYNVRRIYNAIHSIYDMEYPEYTFICRASGVPIEKLIPNLFLGSNADKSKYFSPEKPIQPLRSNLSKPYTVRKGLQNKYIALWPSHGRYFDQAKMSWTWQRPVIFRTVEDLLSESFVLPYLLPMLENAGAQVFLPRERDLQNREVIVDNDMSSDGSRYLEYNDRYTWNRAQGGFANFKEEYVQGENPFREGTFKFIRSTTDSTETSRIEWVPEIPVKGNYALYISYKSFPNSADDVIYTVNHLGGKTSFRINQTMGGGTWIYLGNFDFGKGKSKSQKVTLTNLCGLEDKVITADAIRIGGGMGNIARTSTKKDSLGNSAPPVTSQLPRFMEGSRYWLQWAGAPDSVYSRTQNTNDYSDDFQSRGYWVNYLAGGSSALPKANGLNIPLDMAFALHTDAGYNKHDSIIGTLGIFTVRNTFKSDFYANGSSRWAARDLTDIIQSRIVDDIRKTIYPDWTRRGLWNRSYSESRVPEVPTMLLELLSHQNFADMILANDPKFKFAISRSIYKGMLSYFHSIDQETFKIEPLAVHNFSCIFQDKNTLKLHWKATVDELDPELSTPDSYILYTRMDDGAFDQGRKIHADSCSVSIKSGPIYSFRITAINEGGESFPSEILSACRTGGNHPEVLIVNAYDRISGPDSFISDTIQAGFLDIPDQGVSYLRNIDYTGSQTDLERNSPYVNMDEPGFGTSNQDFENQILQGNNFDYPYMHGQAIKSAGYSFCSISRDAWTENKVNTSTFKFVDLILGKQRKVHTGISINWPYYETFPLALQNRIERLCQEGGRLFASGMYVASDLYSSGDPKDQTFANQVLRIKLKKHGKVDNLNDGDELEPASNEAFIARRYHPENTGAAIAYKGMYRTFILGMPFENIGNKDARNDLMNQVLTFLTKKSRKDRP